MNCTPWVRQQNCGRFLEQSFCREFPPVSAHAERRTPARRNIGVQGVSDLSALSAPRLISLKGCAPAQSPTQHMLSPADVGDGRRAGNSYGRVRNTPICRASVVRGWPSVDPLRVSVDRHTPQHCSVLSTTISARCVHDSVRKIILAYRHRGAGARGGAVAHHELGRGRPR
jgi:hypothetical protein